MIVVGLENQICVVDPAPSIASYVTSGYVIKGQGNTGSGVENGDWQIVTDAQNNLSMQYRSNGAWVEKSDISTL